MALRKEGSYWYGDDAADLRAEVGRYSQLNGYVAEHFADARCLCGADTFRLYLDAPEGVAARVCAHYGGERWIGDSEEFLESAELEQSICLCDNDTFQISVGVSLYPESNDVRWLYLGCRCASCGLVGVYADWKNEFHGFEELLRRI